jgi:hypothetical protein
LIDGLADPRAAEAEHGGDPGKGYKARDARPEARFQPGNGYQSVFSSGYSETEYKNKKASKVLIARALFSVVLSPFITVFFGWIVHLFM